MSPADRTAAPRVPAILRDAGRDVRASWNSFVRTDLAYKALAFALLIPGTTLLLAWMRSGRVIADADIARFFATTRVGALILIVGSALLLAITALQAACLMAIALCATNGVRLRATSALAFGAARAPNVLRLTANVVVRVLVGFLPFLAGAGLVYFAFLRDHDINYYLAQHPPAFWAAGVLVVLLGAALVALLVWTIARWAFALPLVLFEGVSPRRALGESARRSAGHRRVIVAVIATWALVAIVLSASSTWFIDVLGRSLAPRFAGSLVLLLGFLAALVLLWFVLGLAVAIVNFAFLSALVVRLYLHVGQPREPRVPASSGDLRRLSGSGKAGLAAIVVLGVAGFALLAFYATRSHQEVLVIAHRGSSAAAPENTLAAFHLAADQGTDFVELDVQESKDGQVVVVHDSDLMKVGKSPAKIWDADAAALREIDIGSFRGPQFASERVPTLAEALAACKGRCRVIVELKSYGHNQRLEERVVEIVEAAGMERDCIFMSLDHEMVRNIKRLRPSWRAGLLVAKAIGDLTELPADFLAVEARIATGRFVRRAHRAGKDVYVWTVNDPAWMLAAMSHGVDGLITDKPDLAREVLARRGQMSDAQRFLVALLVRLGARTEALESEQALRP